MSHRTTRAFERRPSTPPPSAPSIRYMFDTRYGPRGPSRVFDVDVLEAMEAFTEEAERWRFTKIREGGDFIERCPLGYGSLLDPVVDTEAAMKAVAALTLERYWFHSQEHCDEFRRLMCMEAALRAAGWGPRDVRADSRDRRP